MSVNEYKNPYRDYDIYEVKVSEIVEGIVRVHAKSLEDAIRYLEEEESAVDIAREMSKDEWKLKIEKPYEGDCISTCETYHFEVPAD